MSSLSRFSNAILGKFIDAAIISVGKSPSRHSSDLLRRMYAIAKDRVTYCVEAGDLRAIRRLTSTRFGVSAALNAISTEFFKTVRSDTEVLVTGYLVTPTVLEVDPKTATITGSLPTGTMPSKVEAVSAAVLESYQRFASWGNDEKKAAFLVSCALGNLATSQQIVATLFCQPQHMWDLAASCAVAAGRPNLFRFLIDEWPRFSAGMEPVEAAVYPLKKLTRLAYSFNRLELASDLWELASETGRCHVVTNTLEALDADSQLKSRGVATQKHQRR